MLWHPIETKCEAKFRAFVFGALSWCCGTFEKGED